MEQLTALISHAFETRHLEKLRSTFPDVRFVTLPEDGNVPPEGRGAKVLLRASISKEALSRAVSQLPDLQWLHSNTAGFDWVLVPELDPYKVIITRSANSSSIAIGEFVIGLIFLTAKRFPALLKAQQERVWRKEPELDEVGGKTVGIIGAGAIGREVAKRAAALGMKVIGTKRTPEPQPYFEEVLPADRLPDLLQRSDYVVVACPLTPETRGLIGKAELRQMKPTAVLINVARGPIVVEADLIRALKEGWIAGACADAFDVEPLPSDSPLWDVENLIITPHISWVSPHGFDRVLDEFMENLHRFLKGEPLLNRLRDPKLGY